MIKTLSAFAVSPPKTSFQAQNDHEKIVLLLRQHPITNAPWLIIFSLLLALPWILFSYKDIVLKFFPFERLYSLPPKILLFLFIFWAQLAALYFLFNFIQWYYSILLVTNQRVLDVDVVGFLYRHIAEAELEEIQDVSYSQGGLFGLLFNFGSIYLQTAGETQHIEILRAPQPGRVHDLITDLL